MTAGPKIGDDLLWGVDAIAKETGLTPRQTYWQLETGVLPGGKSGQTWVASRQRLSRHFLELTATCKPHGKTGKTNKNRVKKTASA